MVKDSEGRWVESPVHQWFGLSYANYFTMPRMALEAMPLEWQERFVALMNELSDTGIEPPDYYVLREDPFYNCVEREDPEDETSTIHSITLLQPDPWSEYRHPDLSLLPDSLKGY